MRIHAWTLAAREQLLEADTPCRSHLKPDSAVRQVASTYQIRLSMKPKDEHRIQSSSSDGASGIKGKRKTWSSKDVPTMGKAIVLQTAPHLLPRYSKALCDVLEV